MQKQVEIVLTLMTSQRQTPVLTDIAVVKIGRIADYGVKAPMAEEGGRVPVIEMNKINLLMVFKCRLPCEFELGRIDINSGEGAMMLGFTEDG